MTYMLQRMLPGATTCEIVWQGEFPDETVIDPLLDLLDETERQIKERLNGPKAPNR